MTAGGGHSLTIIVKRFMTTKMTQTTTATAIAGDSTRKETARIANPVDDMAWNASDPICFARSLARNSRVNARIGTASPAQAERLACISSMFRPHGCVSRIGTVSLAPSTARPVSSWGQSG